MVCPVALLPLIVVYVYAAAAVVVGVLRSVGHSQRSSVLNGLRRPMTLNYCRPSHKLSTRLTSGLRVRYLGMGWRGARACRRRLAALAGVAAPPP